MRLRLVSTVLVLLGSGTLHSAVASTPPGVGAFVNAPIAFAVEVSAAGKSYYLATYQDGGLTHVSISRFGLVGVPSATDWISSDPNALTLTTNGADWTVRLSVPSPGLGEITITIESAQTPNGIFGGCGYFYHFTSTTRGLSQWGNVGGAIGVDEVTDSTCLEWGTTVTGEYHTI